MAESKRTVARASRKSPVAEAVAVTARPGLRAIPGALASGPDELDRLIHERMRLAMMSALAVNETLSFNELKDLVGATDGNLSVHARKLEDARYVACTKSFDGRTPRTEYRLTAAGRKALERYLDHVEALLRALRKK